MGECHVQGSTAGRLSQSLFHRLERFAVRGWRREFPSCQDDIRVRLYRQCLGDTSRRGPSAVTAVRALVRAVRRQDIHVRWRRAELHRDQRDLGV